MNIQNIEKKEKNMATFEVKVPADVFDNAVNEAYKKNKNHLYVAGFRKGKAPRAVIEGMYGKEVFYPDAIEALAEDAFEAGRADCGFECVGAPSLIDQKVTEDKELIYTFEVGMYPEVQLGQYNGLEVPQNHEAFDESKVDEEMHNVQKRNARLLDDRIIMLSEEVNDTTASLIVAQLLYLEAQDPDKDIQFYINSPGGSVTAGLAIYDTMQYIKADVSTICVGLAASMGAFLLSSGTKGKRLALPNSEIMIHQPSGGSQGQCTDIQIQARQILRIKDRLNHILAENTGKPVETIAEDCERDNFMTAEEAQAYGLVDKVIYKR